MYAFRVSVDNYLLHVEPEGDKNGHTRQLLTHKACFFYNSPVAVMPDSLISPQFLQESAVHVIIREWLMLPQNLPPGHSLTRSTVWSHHPDHTHHIGETVVNFNKSHNYQTFKRWMDGWCTDIAMVNAVYKITRRCVNNNNNNIHICI